ncbi:MAG TPA: pectin acetylesterase-family hydrolase [Labilithrix sp.]|nr:pectin acetylesterase-family hydrolase [Labilithrix sp.]
MRRSLLAMGLAAALPLTLIQTLIGCDSSSNPDPEPEPPELPDAATATDSGTSVRDAEPPRDASAPKDADVALDARREGGLTLGDPIVVSPADQEKWVWVPIPDMHCSDGSSAGVAVNFTNKSRDLVIFFQGGGACWNAVTCATQGENLKPVGPNIGDWMPGADGHSGIFNRADASNPLTKANFVYVPYCTGDGHLGNKVASYGVHHVGYANATAALKRIVPTFTDAPNIVVAGFSAGGMGVTGNYHQIAAAFEAVGRPVITSINDSGPVLRKPYLTENTQNTLRNAWGLDKTIETWCPTCKTEGFHDIYRRMAELHPGQRGSLISSYDDHVVRLLYGALGSGVEFGRLREGLLDLATWEDGFQTKVAPSTLRQFYYGGDRHGAIEIYPLSDTPGLVPFLKEQLGAGTWKSVRP